jgi:hypothetical protein
MLRLNRLALAALIAVAPARARAVCTWDTGAHGTNTAQSGTTIAFSITTSNANETVIVYAGANALGGGSAITVTGVADTGTHSWTRRTARAWDNNVSQHINHEIWWAPFATATTVTITVTFSGALQDAVAGGFGIIGASNQAAPFDTNGALPTTNQDLSGTATQPTVTMVTTAATADLLTFCGNASLTNTCGTAAAGYTTMINVSLQRPSGSVSTTAAHMSVTTAQASGSVNVGNGAVSAWVTFGDAIACQASQGGLMPHAPW